MNILTRIIWNSKTRRLVLRILRWSPIKRGRVICVCWGGAKYNCNPRAITDQMVSQGLVSDRKAGGPGRFEICYAFSNPDAFQHEVPAVIDRVEIGSLRYFYLLATSHFIIANTRFGGGLFWPFPKRSGQYYIQTMHGGHGLKRVELDVRETLSEDYIQGIFADAERIDLMISDSTAWTRCARTAFAFPEGEVMEVGLPRNDVFFQGDAVRDKYRDQVISLVSQQKNITLPQEPRFLIYAPTFRSNGRRDGYGFDVERVLKALTSRFGGEWFVLVSSHPNMREYYHEIYDFSHPRMVDMGKEDLQLLLVAGDALITDYSSSGMDFSLTGHPVFQLCRDIADYDRGFYFDPRTLPFPYAEDDDVLVRNIVSFDEEDYHQRLAVFNRDVVGLKETGHASQTIVGWMLDRL